MAKKNTDVTASKGTIPWWRSGTVWTAIGAIGTFAGIAVAVMIHYFSTPSSVPSPPHGEKPSITKTSDCTNGICPNIVATTGATVNVNTDGGQARLLLPPDPDEPSVEYNTAKNYYEQRNYAKAREYFQLAYDKQKKLKGRLKDKDTADYLARLSAMDFELARYGDAVDEMNHAKAIYAKLPDNETDQATIYNNLGVIFNDLGDYAMALVFYNKALDIKEKVLGKEHPNTATTYNNIAFVYEAQGKHEQALDLWLKAYKIRRLKLGEAHPDTKDTFISLQRAHKNTGNPQPFDEWLRQALGP